MRRLCVLIVCVAVGSLPEACPAAEITYHNGSHAGGYRDDQVGYCGTQAGDYYDSRSGCNRFCCRRGHGWQRWMCSGHGRRMAAVGNFNCGCRGSYKFPVPPQYTYHWPGLYSRQTMTGYTSPWRFPPLKPYRGESY